MLMDEMSNGSIVADEPLDRTLAAYWADLLATVAPGNPPPGKVEALRLMFYAGAHSVLEILCDLMDDIGADPDIDDEVMETLLLGLQREVREVWEGVKGEEGGDDA
jgi:hypothetical protein